MARNLGTALAFLALAALLPSASAAEPELRLVAQQPPNLAAFDLPDEGGSLLLEARLALGIEAPLYLKLVPGAPGRDHAYRNGTASADHARALGGWTHELALRDAAGRALGQDARGVPLDAEFGHYATNEPTPAVLLAPGEYVVRARLAVPPGALPPEGLEVQVRYHAALDTAKAASRGGGGVQDPAVALEWNLRLRPGGAAAPEEADPAPPAARAREGGSAAASPRLEAPAAGAALALAALAAVAGARRRRGQ